MLEDEKKGRRENRCGVILIPTIQHWTVLSSNFIPFSSQSGQIAASTNFSVI